MWIQFFISLNSLNFIVSIEERNITREKIIRDRLAPFSICKNANTAQIGSSFVTLLATFFQVDNGRLWHCGRATVDWSLECARLGDGTQTRASAHAYKCTHLATPLPTRPPSDSSYRLREETLFVCLIVLYLCTINWTLVTFVHSLVFT